MLKNFENDIFHYKIWNIIIYNSGKWKPREYIEFMKENETKVPFKNC